MPLPAKIPRGGRASKSKPKDTKRILANRYIVARRLGSGNFGTAWLVEDKKSRDKKDDLKVLKEIPVGDLKPDETIDAVHESSLLRNLDHPGIVKFHDSFIDDNFFCIVTEFCDGGDLDQRIAKAKKEDKPFPEAQVVEWLIQLLLALQYMHDRKVLHRDLKTRNIFLRNNVIKVGDFGISRILMGTTDMASTFVGTPYYMSPEVLKHEGYNSKSDVWSIGCVLYEMVQLRHAFEGQSLMGVMYKIVEGSLPEWNKTYSSELEEVFKSLCIKDPHSRPSAAEALKITFIARQMELLKNTMMDKHHQKEQKESISTERQQLRSALAQQKRLDELREESESQKWKNLTPRERMRLKKQLEADEKARRMHIAAMQQRIDNQMTYADNKRNMNPYDTHFNFEGETKEIPQKKGPDFIDYSSMDASVRKSAHSSDEEILSDGADEEDEGEGTVIYKPSQTEGGKKISAGGSGSFRAINSLSRTWSHDERPITPMKNTMIYDVDHSSLDFKDDVPGEFRHPRSKNLGRTLPAATPITSVPENPRLAETFYSQFEDFEDDDDDDNEGTLVAATPGNEEEMEDLINCMQNALDKSETLKSQTLTDKSTAGVFGPVARSIKIKNLRGEAEAKLGKAEFERAYEYLKSARFGSNVGSSAPKSETDIMKGLGQIVKNPNDCFIVDQLLFLEAQADISQS